MEKSTPLSQPPKSRGTPCPHSGVCKHTWSSVPMMVTFNDLTDSTQISILSSIQDICWSNMIAKSKNPRLFLNLRPQLSRLHRIMNTSDELWTIHASWQLVLDFGRLFTDFSSIASSRDELFPCERRTDFSPESSEGKSILRLIMRQCNQTTQAIHPWHYSPESISAIGKWLLGIMMVLPVLLHKL